MVNRTTTQPLQQPANLLHRLLAQGDSVSIERGKLVILPASGKPVPSDWLVQNSPALTRQILQAVSMDAYQYTSYTTGSYEGGKMPGLTLQLQSVITQTETHAIFNVLLTRARSTAAGKKGSPLPAGHFRINQKHDLHRFWQSTGLPLRRGLSAMHDYMGNLKGILFSASPTAGRTDGRLIASTLQALNIPAAVICQAVLPDNSRTSAGHDTDNDRTTVPDKQTPPAQQSRGLQPFSGTGGNSHGKAVIRKCGHTVVPFPSPSRKKPEDQTVDEWLADYSSPSSSP